MRPYNIEIFSRSFAFKVNMSSSAPVISEDYITPEESTVEILDTNASVAVGDYIRITNENTEYSGVISSVARAAGSKATVSFKPFLSLFEAPVLFDTNLQGTSTMEAVMAGIVRSYWCNNADTEQNIEGLSVTTVSSTATWGLNLKSDAEGKHHCIVDFYNTFIVRSLEKYRIVFTVSMDWQNKSINLRIGKLAADTRRIELGLPNILNSNVIIRQTENTVNKLVVYSQEDYATNKVFYLHPDGTYNTTNTNRITPVVFSVQATEVADTTFDKAAASVAAETFGSIEYNNLIELQVKSDDEMIRPLEMQIGQTAKIIHKNKEYTSILTGRTVNGIVTLSFGTIRLDLTKIIKRRYS